MTKKVIQNRLLKIQRETAEEASKLMCMFCRDGWAFETFDTHFKQIENPEYDPERHLCQATAIRQRFMEER